MKTLSVLMPNFNHGRYIRNALEAILKQSFKPIEIIVADDASTDNSIEVVEAYASKYDHIRLIRNHSRKGVVENVNAMLRMASGDYVIGAAADDLVLPGLFETSMTLLDRFPNAGLCSTLSRKIDEHGRDLGIFPSPIASFRPRFISPYVATRHFAQGRAWIMGNTAIYNRRFLMDEGGFNPTLLSYTDGLMQMVLAIKHGACFIPKPLACWRLLDSSFSAMIRENIELWHEALASAESIAKNRYLNLFPEDFLRRWKAHQLLQVALWELYHPPYAVEKTSPPTGTPNNVTFEDKGAKRLREIVNRIFAGANCALRILGFRRMATKALQRAVDHGYIKYLAWSKAVLNENDTFYGR